MNQRKLGRPFKPKQRGPTIFAELRQKYGTKNVRRISEAYSPEIIKKIGINEFNLMVKKSGGLEKFLKKINKEDLKMRPNYLLGS